MAVEVGKPEKRILKKLVNSGVFKSPDEVVRAAILKYASDLGFLDRKGTWNRITSSKKRDVSPEQLKRDLERIEDET